MDHAAAEAGTERDLSIAYRSMVSSLDELLRRPTAARHQRSTSRAVVCTQDHLGERLTLERVARVAGVSPAYFSKLFSRERGMPFARYLVSLRLERAQRLLGSTDLSVAQVSDLCGFGTHNYFYRVFLQHVGQTPARFREASRHLQPTRRRRKRG